MESGDEREQARFIRWNRLNRRVQGVKLACRTFWRTPARSRLGSWTEDCNELCIGTRLVKAHAQGRQGCPDRAQRKNGRKAVRFYLDVELPSV